MEEQQRAHLTQMLKETQEHHDAQRKAMQASCTDTNRQLAIEKRNRDACMKQELQDAATAEVNFTMTHDFMTENPQTEKSMLAAHRVKPYHFKGLTPEQQAGIAHERALQVNDNKMLATSAKEQEQLWALQTEHMRRQQLLADREYKRKLRQEELDHRAFQEQQKIEHDATVKDHYGEKFTNMRGDAILPDKSNLP